MEHTYKYAWIIPLIPLSITISIGLELLLIPTAAKNVRRMWAFPSVLLLSIIMAFSANLSIRQINGSYVYQYIYSWTVNNDFSFEFGHLIDPLTSIMVILITTVGIMVLFYSDNYMSHDQGYLRFYTSMSFSTISMLGLVTSTNLVQIYIFWELVGMCSYLLIGFWFTRPTAANACQKAFVTNRVGDFGLLLGILGFYWITGSFEFRELFEILNKLIPNNRFHFLFATLCAFLLFVGAIAKSAQFPLHIWLPDAMEGPTPISALIHAATMVAAGIFLVARFFPIFRVIPHIMWLISLIGIITVLLGATLSLAQRDIKKSLAYSTMSQLGYTMLAMGIGSYRAALFHLITHAYSKALLFLASGSIIHSMESIVGYSPDKSQNMVLMGGLTKYVPITKTTFYVGTLSLCGIPPLSCFWSKDEILNDSWLYSPLFAIIAYSAAGLTAFYMFRVYLLTFEGHLRVQLQNYSGAKNSSLYSIPIWGKGGMRLGNKSLSFLLIKINNYKERLSFFSNEVYQMDRNGRNPMQSFSTRLDKEDTYVYPYESDNTMLLPLLILFLFTLFVGSIGIPFEGLGMGFDILSKWLIPSITFLQKNLNYSVNWYEFVTNSIFSVSIAYFGVFIASLFYGSVYSSFQNLDLFNSFTKMSSKRVFSDRIIYGIYSWSYNRGYIDVFYATFLIKGIRGLSLVTRFYDERIIDGITNSVGITTFFVGEGIKYLGGGRISSYLFIFLSCVLGFIILYLSIYTIYR